MSKKSKATKSKQPDLSSSQVLIINIIITVVTILAGAISFFKNIVELSPASKIICIIIFSIAYVIVRADSNGKIPFIKVIEPSLGKSWREYALRNL